ncbi:MAG: DUF72 domain-containing protein [candidate division Zixibacteria bacterium]|nr:DUF72 domain-containing protein [candidate division Zixibacteria bacterium]
MEVRIGTSGYSFDDWRGNFYPGQIQKGKMLDHYQAYFNTVEINSTYYRIPHPAIMYNIVKKTKPEFDFFIKANQNLTHHRQDFEQPAEEFLECIRPMVDTNQLKGIIAQYPWSFKYSPRNLEYLRLCRELMMPHPFFIEFRHDSWLRQETFAMMKSEGIHNISVDGPRLRGLLPPELTTTTDTAYIRLHGRNSEHWWNGGALRYDYNYNEDELQEWKNKIDKLQQTVKKTYIFFNNCHLGQAVKNARQLMQMFEF